jgi:hypothetical protein
MSGPDIKLADARTEGSEPPAQATPQPPPQPPGLRAWLSSIAQVAVIASLAIYGVGFAIAVPHYLRRTVPVRALTHDVYLGAGLLFFAQMLVGTGIAAGALWIRQMFQRPPLVRDWRLRSVAFLLFLVLAAFQASFAFQVGRVAGVIDVFSTAFATAFWLWAWRTARIGPPDGRLMALCQGTVWAATALFLVAGFSRNVFPSVPPQYGGGAEQLLAALTIPNEVPTGAADAWMKFACRRFPSPTSAATPVCRRFYRVFETADSLYLGIAEWRGLCNSKEKPRRFDESTRRCVQRISNSLLPQLEVDEGPSAWLAW